MSELSPIADLSYRNYDGPLEPPLMRWWPIARVGVLKALKNKWYWVLTILSGSWYLVLMVMFYFVDSFLPQISGDAAAMIDPERAKASFFSGVNWNEQFLHGFSMAQLFLLILALMLGVGTIANDNRANALLVYLSKPCTKLDYVFGKWLGIVIPLIISVAIPTLFFYGYCFMSYREYGFLDHHPYLIFQLMLLITIPAIVHASLAIGISSMFSQGRIAGATYAAIYFFSLFFTKAMQVLHVQMGPGDSASKLVNSLFYFSIDGIQIGLAKALLGTDGGRLIPVGPPGGMGRMAVPAPNGVLISIVAGIGCMAFLLFAWSRIRAVEVVG